tara:strand:- start:361 stop:762 length:402 start_codon:yes stop_codon:yes gene_type:complete
MEYEIPCQWPQCNQWSSRQVHCDNESIHVCNEHRGAVKVNIERFGKIWTFKKAIDDSQLQEKDIVRPGAKTPEYKGYGRKKLPGQPTRQDAAKKADKAAEPVGKVPELVAPRKNREGDERLSRALDAQKKRGQ